MKTSHHRDSLPGQRGRNARLWSLWGCVCRDLGSDLEVDLYWEGGKEGLGASYLARKEESWSSWREDRSDNGEEWTDFPGPC